jgi:hypothetical protein
MARIRLGRFARALLRRRGLQQHQPGREFLAEDSAQGSFVLFLAIEYGEQAIGMR